MKKNLPSFFVLSAVVALGLSLWHIYQVRNARSITVWIQDDTGGGGGPGLAAIDNYINGDSGIDGAYSHVGNFRVVASSPGKFFVLAHYRVEHDGAVENVDVSLPVNPQKPPRDNWIKLNDHLAAVAFYDGSTISY